MTGYEGKDPDGPDTLKFGPLGPMPIFHDDDFRIQAELKQSQLAQKSVDQMTTVEELVVALHGQERGIRGRAASRLILEGHASGAVLDTILGLVSTDPDAYVRMTITIKLCELAPDPAVIDALRVAERDEDFDVRWAAAFSLFQFRLGPHPGSDQEGACPEARWLHFCVPEAQCHAAPGPALGRIRVAIALA